MTGRVNRRQRLRALMFDVQRGECWVCAQRMELRCEPNSPAYATFDEITPRSKGASGASGESGASAPGVQSASGQRGSYAKAIGASAGDAASVGRGSHMLTDFRAHAPNTAVPSGLLFVTNVGVRVSAHWLYPTISYRWRGELRLWAPLPWSIVGSAENPDGTRLVLSPTSGRQAIVHTGAIAVPEPEARALLRQRWPAAPHPCLKMRSQLRRAYPDQAQADEARKATEAVRRLQGARGG